MYFEKIGRGEKTLVFLHGWGGNHQSWRPIAERLKDKFVIYTLDLPGFGASPLPRAFDLADYAREVERFLEAEKITKAVLVGHSFGGSVAIKTCLLFPEKVAKLILVDSAGLRKTDFFTGMEIALVGRIRKTVINTPFKKFYPRARDLYCRLRGLQNSDYNLAENENLRQTLSRIFAEDLSNQLDKIMAPTLLFWGEKDPEDYTPLSHAEIFQEKIPNARLIVVPEAGHFSYLSDQKKFVEAIKDFVQ